MLTYFLIEALRGPTELIDVDRISLCRLLDYVTSRVKAAANLIGQSQNPTMPGQIDGEVIWPVIVPGERFIRAFPNHAPASVTADLASLSAFGFLLISAWGQAIPSLNVVQIGAINDYGLLDGDHLVVSALVQIAGAGKRPVLYCRDFKLGARHSTLQAQVDLGHPDVPVRIVPCGCDASIRYRRS